MIFQFPKILEHEAFAMMTLQFEVGCCVEAVLQSPGRSASENKVA
jgi:hypothetical protein